MSYYLNALASAPSWSQVHGAQGEAMRLADLSRRLDDENIDLLAERELLRLKLRRLEQFPIHEHIRGKWSELGGVLGTPGAPLGVWVYIEGTSRWTRGTMQDFERARIFASVYGVYAVVPPIYGTYQKSNVPERGFPTTKMFECKSHSGIKGHFQRFEGAAQYPTDVIGRIGGGSWGATVYGSAEYGVYVTHGSIGACYERWGGTMSRLGFPASEEAQAAMSKPWGTVGKFQRFESNWTYPDDVLQRLGGRKCGATIYYSTKTGAWPTWGAIGAHYERMGGTSSRFGLPRGDEITYGSSPNRTVKQSFEGGAVVWVEASNSVREEKS